MADQPPSPPPGGMRYRRDRLTDEEVEHLEAQGVDLSQDFVDLPAPERPQMVDPEAQERRETARALESIAAQSSPQLSAPRGLPDLQLTEELQQTKEELSRVKQELQAANEELSQKADNCPRCYWPVDRKEVIEPTKEDIGEFLKSVVAGDLYRKSFSLWGGNLTVTFRSRTAQEDDAIKRTTRRMLGSLNITPEEAMFNIQQLNYIVSLESIETGDRRQQMPKLDEYLSANPDRQTSVDAWASEQMSQMPSQIGYALFNTYREFNELLEVLISRAQDPNYWRET